MNWINALGVLCDCRIPIKLEGNIYKAANSPALLAISLLSKLLTILVGLTSLAVNL